MKVSVCVITYNHERLIIQCIDSILFQECRYPFELVIGEDGSTDNTRGIIENYVKEYPDRIRLLPDEGNLGMIPNFIRTLRNCTGKYIAICEGDDYWTDPNKLQKQVDFLEANPEYVLCFTDNTFYYENEERFEPQPQEDVDTLVFKDILRKNQVSTLTVLFRNNMIALDEDFAQLSVGDWPLYVLLSQYGKLKRLPFISGVYRVHDSNNFFKGDYLDKKRKLTEALEYLYNRLDVTYAPAANKKLIRSYLTLITEYRKQNKYNEAGGYLMKLKEMNGLSAKIGLLTLNLRQFLNM